ncbi:MAG: hypothetical protein CSA83_01650 [Actinomycetales bacterium]|nr:MAG: hypothetical protein CSA83_01650 [Actinomycetales bacterium]
MEPDRVPKILELFRKEDILQESYDKTRQIRSDIAVATDGSGQVIVTADWPDETGYQEWLDHPDRLRTAPKLEQILAGADIGVGRLYQIVDQAPSDQQTPSER